MTLLAAWTFRPVADLDSLNACTTEAVSTASGLIGFSEDEETYWTLTLKRFRWFFNEFAVVSNLLLTRHYDQKRLHVVVLPLTFDLTLQNLGHTPYCFIMRMFLPHLVRFNTVVFAQFAQLYLGTRIIELHP